MKMDRSNWLELEYPFSFNGLIQGEKYEGIDQQ